MNIKRLIEELSKEVIRINGLYNEAMNEFNAMTEKDLTPEEFIKIKQIIAKCNMAYQQLAPAFNYIVTTHDHAQSMIKHWSEFVEKINKEMPEEKVLH